METYSIGEAARRTGLKVPTIRYYEDIGLLPKRPRAENNRRHFDQRSLARLTFIKRARNLGFNVADIGALLDLQDQPDKSCTVVDSIARARLADIEVHIRELKALRGELREMIGGCHRDKVANCNILEELKDRPR